MKQIVTLKRITNPYSKRILSNIVDRDAWKIYCRTPSELERLLRGLTRAEVEKVWVRGKWSISYLVSHLCDAEWATGFRIRRAIAECGCSFQAYDQDKWAERLYYKKSDFRQKILLFTSLRAANIALLRSLKPAEWNRYGIHEERGKETVERMVQMLAGHDLNHLRQIAAMKERAMGKHVGR